MCDRVPACQLTPMSREEFPTWKWDGEAIGRKAASRPSTREVWFDRSFWDSLPSWVARLAFYLHEVGHLEGAICESCADRRAGEWLAKLGISDDENAIHGFLERIQYRNGAKAAQELHGGFAHKAGAPLQGCPVGTSEAGLCMLPQAPAKSSGVMFTKGADGALVLGWDTPEIDVSGNPPGGCFPDMGNPKVYQAIRREERRRGYGADRAPFVPRGWPGVWKPGRCGYCGGIKGADTDALIQDLNQIPEIRAAGVAWKIAEQAGQQNLMDPEAFAWLTAAVGMIESNWTNPKTVSPTGDLGYMQINGAAHPAYASEIWSDGTRAVFVPVRNIEMGTGILLDAIREFPGDVYAAVSAYNAGPSRVRARLAAGLDPDDNSQDRTGTDGYAVNVFDRLNDWNHLDLFFDTGGASNRPSMPAAVAPSHMGGAGVLLVVLLVVLFLLSQSKKAVL